MQFLPQDSLFCVQLHSDLQTLGRMKRVCQYLNDETNIETILAPILKNPCYDDFKVVEKFLYHHAPRIPILEKINASQELRNRCAAIINAHVEKVDSSIKQVYFPIKCGSFGKYFTNTLKLTEDDRIAFYFGKLPGQITSSHDSSADEYGDFNDPIINAAHQDALYATEKVNVARLRMMLNCYKQFPNYYELLGPLCKLGNSTLLLDYLSIQGRGIDYTEEAGSLTALELAGLYGQHELVQFLLEHEKKLLQQNN
jgi:hypothetical protein